MLELNSRYGELTVKKVDHVNKESHEPVYLCQCTCKRYIKVHERDLLSGQIYSCQDLRCKLRLIGQQFGDLVITALDRCQPKNVWCKCKCGKKKSLPYNSLITGTIKTCGCGIKHSAVKYEYQYSPKLKEFAINNIRNFLRKNNINFKTNEVISDSLYSNKFDFCFYNDCDELIGVLNISGKRHPCTSGTAWMQPNRKTEVPKEEYNKRLFCERNEIPFLEVPYSVLDFWEIFITTSEFWDIICQ